MACNGVQWRGYGNGAAPILVLAAIYQPMTGAA